MLTAMVLLSLKTRKFTWFPALFLFMALSVMAFAAPVQKDFSFRLEPGEASKTWNVQVGFPSNQAGRFIEREFTTKTDSTDVEMRVIRESLSPAKYTLKASLYRINSKSNALPVTGSLEVTLNVGTVVPNDKPNRPKMVGWEGVLVWFGDGDQDKTKPVSGKYLSYQICSGDTNEILDEQVIPVYVRGFRIPLPHWQFRREKKYTLYVRLSNGSGKYSEPHVVKVAFPARKTPNSNLAH